MRVRVIGRRSLLASFVAAACSRRDSSDDARHLAADPPATLAAPVAAAIDAGVPEAGSLARGEVGMQSWSFDGGGRAVAIVPGWASTETRFPLLVALHGRGEALKGPDNGVMGWPRDYALLRAIRRICAPPLTNADFEGFADAKRLAETNADLAAHPFRGLVVVCPYAPDLDLRKLAGLREYGEYLLRSVLPRARRELPVYGTPATTGIDGVSLGGALALRVGLGNPEAFGALGTLQPAIGEDQVAEFTELARIARARNPALKLRLLTSKEDYFRNAIARTSAAWRAAGLVHDYADVPGPHDYPFNRGPGALEMLHWHERVLTHG